MTEKKIDIRKSVFELCNEYPELLELLSEIGFRDIAKPGMLSTAGRFMTLSKGAKLKRIDMEVIIDALIKHGYTIEQ